MKNILIFLIIWQCSNLFSQKPPEFNSSNTAGIFYYDVEETLKASRIKKKKNKVEATKALRVYNSKVKKISFLNSFKFKELDQTMNLAYKNFANLQLEQKQSLKTKLEEIIKPIRDTLEVAENKLNDKFSKMLSKKQLKKWKKYQRAQKRKLLPEQKNNNARPPQPMQNRGMGGGMGRGRRF